MTRGTGAQAGDELVIGTAIGLPLKQVTPFIQSLRNAGYMGTVALFVDRRLERDLHRTPLTNGLITIRARQWLPFKLKLLDRPRAMRLLWGPIQTSLWTAIKMLRHLPLSEVSRRRLALPVALLHYTPMDARFLRYERFLGSRPYGRVLVSDVRDVIFQRDPFADLPRQGLAVSMETASYTVATEPHNAMWLARAYGPGMLDRIGDQRVSCVGVTYGDATAIATYLRLFNQELLGLAPQAAGIGGADTAIHNMLLHTGQLGEARLLEPLRSPVATLNEISEATIQLSAAGHLLNEDGSEPSVLHQYDRLPRLGERLRATLAS